VDYCKASSATQFVRYACFADHDHPAHVPEFSALKILAKFPCIKDSLLGPGTYRKCVRVNVRTNDETNEAAHASTKPTAATTIRVVVICDVRNSMAVLRIQTQVSTSGL